MHRVLNILSARVSGMHQAAYILGSFTILSSLLAFVRDRLLAHTFGAGGQLDLYYAAFKIPDLIFVSVASLVSAYVLIPILAASTEERQRTYVDTIMAGFFLLIAAVSVVVFVIAPLMLEKVFPTLAEGKDFDVLVVMTRIMLIQPILLGFSNIFAAISQFKGRYILYATTSLLYNIGIIIGVVFLFPFLGLAGLAWGVVFGAALHAGVQIPSLMRDGFLRRLPGIHRMSFLVNTASVSLPRALALSMNQITIFALIVIAGGLAAGSIAVFTFAFNLQAVPLAIIGASYSVAAFPTLARMAADGNGAKFVTHVVSAARHILFWSLPTIALVIVLRAHIVRVLLGTGAFDWTDTRLTAAAFALFVLSLTAHAFMLLLIRGYYAMGRTLVPVIVSLVTMITAIVLGLVFLKGFAVEDVQLFIESLLRVADVQGTSVLTLPLAYTAASFIGVVLLVFVFERDFGGFFSGISRAFWNSVTAAFAGGVATYGVLTVLGGISEATTLLTVFGHGLVAGVVGIFATIAALWMLGSREYAEVIEALHRRYRAVFVLSSEDEL